MAGPLLADRIKETTTTTGTGTLTLLGASTGFRSFSVFADADTCYYVVVGTTGEWEVGLGTVGAAGTTLARTTVLSSSNAGSAVDFAAGTKQVFCAQPANAAVVRGNYLNTDASNYQRWSIVPSVSAITFTAETAGTGADNIDIELLPAGTGLVRVSNNRPLAVSQIDATYVFVGTKIGIRADFMGVALSSDLLVAWANTTANYFTGNDTGIGRNAAGVVEVNNGTPGTIATLRSQYQSSDGSAGVTVGPYTTITSITVKNGLVTALAGS